MDAPQSNPTTESPATLNRALVDGLKKRSLVKSAAVEAAFRAVPRHIFMPHLAPEAVYVDKALPVKRNEEGRWISSSSQPAMMAIMLDQLDLQAGHNVLEIGAGSGYNAAVMAHIVGKTGQVTTIDLDQDLAVAAKAHLDAAGYTQVRVLCADGGFGHNARAPYDRIILTVRPPEIAPAWFEQLKPGGRLVLPLEVLRSQLSLAFDRVETALVSRSARPCGFMTLRGEFEADDDTYLQLGPEPGLSLDAVNAVMSDPDLLYQWLTGDSRDWASGVTVTAGEFWSGLTLWSMMHEPRLAGLSARGPLAERNIVPFLLGGATEQPWVSTGLLLGERGMAALMRPPDQWPDWAELNDFYAPDTPFEINVRQYGPDQSLPRRLIGLLKAWDASDRPAIERVLIRAYPKGTNYSATTGEFVLEKRWMTYLIRWT